MDYSFKSLTNKQFIDLIPYIKNKIIENPGVELYVGCDSQTHGKFTDYVCVIVLHYPYRGGHVIYSELKVKKIADRFSRLWKEVEISVEISTLLRDNNIIVKYLDLDLNPNPKYGSNMVIKPAVGFVEAAGFTPRVKPDAVSASHCADLLCK